MPYSITYPLAASDFDANGVLNPYVLLKYLEDIAVKNASDNHFGVEEVAIQQVAWVLLKYTMEFSDYPQGIQELVIETESRGVNRLFAIRDFTIKDAEGAQLGRVSSTWAVIDIDSKRMLNPQEVFKGCLPKLEKRADDLNYRKISPVTPPYQEQEFSVQAHDIDLNQHVNNCVYMNWALGTLDAAWTQGKKLSRLDINYKREVLQDEAVISRAQTSENTSSHAIHHAETGDELSLLLAQWERLA